MAFFPWTDAYSTGIREVDTQHRKLVELLNELYEAMYVGQGREALGLILSGLLQYTRTHFRTEERLMQSHGFPEYPEHREIHEKMAARVMDLQTAFEQNRISNPIQISNFLKDWLQKHILGTDMKYAEFLKRKGVR